MANIKLHELSAKVRAFNGISIPVKPPRAKRGQGRTGRAKAEKLQAMRKQRQRKYVEYQPYAQGVIVLPLYLPSLANMRGHWRKREELTQYHRPATRAALNGVVKPTLPVKVTFTRLGPILLDDDNAQISCKRVRDEVAAWLGVDDGNRQMFRCEYAQEKCDSFGVKIRIEMVLFAEVK